MNFDGCGPIHGMLTIINIHAVLLSVIKYDTSPDTEKIDIEKIDYSPLDR